jgi:hypothetical protein
MWGTQALWKNGPHRGHSRRRPSLKEDGMTGQILSRASAVIGVACDARS